MSKKLFYYNLAKIHKTWEGLPDRQWLDWRWQMTHRITSPAQLQTLLYLTQTQTQQITQSLNQLRMAITPYYLSQIDPDDPDCPIRLQAIPSLAETQISSAEAEDPLHEDVDSPDELKGILTHRYPDRLIIYLTYQCSMYCRHCTRRRWAGESDVPTSMANLEKAIEYIKNHTMVRDILLSGGDPFTLSNSRIDQILTKLRAIKHVEIIRFGTRTPVVMPMRIDDELIKVLKKHQPIWINTHFNHPKEMTDLAASACQKIVDAGIPLGNQSVLLKGINNHPQIQKRLVQLLTANRVRPYYLYQCDLSQGLEHFRTRVSEGIEIIENLRGHVSGFAVPTFVIDGIGGGGKVPVMPNYVLSQSHHKWVLRNYAGKIFNYTEPTDCNYQPPKNWQKYCPVVTEINAKKNVGSLLDSQKNETNL